MLRDESKRFRTSLRRRKARRIAQPLARRTQLLLEALEDRTLLNVSFLNNPPWLDQGPYAFNDPYDGTWAGAVESVVTGPANGNFYPLYAASVNGGIWEGDYLSGSPSTLSWFPLTDQLPSLAISALALDPTDSSGNTLWAGTGSLSSAGRGGGAAVGLYKTTDAGFTWTQLASADLEGSPVWSVVPTTVIDSGTKQQVVLAASEGQGIMRSTDGGSSFTNVLNGTATDLVADPNDSSRFYAAVGDTVYRSDDAGKTWNYLNNFVLSFELKLAVTTQGNTTVLYVATSEQFLNITDGEAQLNGVWRAEIDQNGQANSSWHSIDVHDLLVDRIPADRRWGHFALVADPTNPNVVYVGGYENNIFRGDASQDTWTDLDHVNGTDTHADIRHLAFLNNNTLLATCDGGIYLLTNPSNPGSNDHWVPLNGAPGFGLGVTEFFRVAYDPKNGVIFGGAQDIGTSVQQSPYNSVWKKSAGGDGGWVAADANGVHYYFDDDQLFRDGTKVKLNGLNSKDQPGGDFSIPIVVNSANQSQLLLGYTHVYESFDQGDNLNDVTPSGMAGNVTYLAYGTNNSGAAYVATDKGELFVRTTSQGTFTPTSNPWGTNAINDVVVDPLDFQTAYVLAANRVWQTTDAGSHWTELTENLDQVANVNGILNLDTIQLADGVLVAGGYGGVFRLLDYRDGPRWTRYGDNPYLGNLPNAIVTDLHYIPPNQNDPTKGDLLVAGTLGRGAGLVNNVSQTIANPVILQVSGDNDYPNEDDVIRLVLHAQNSSLLDVYINNALWGRFDLSEIGGIDVNGLGGNDTLIVDESNGLIRPPHMDPSRTSYVSYDGGPGANALMVDDSKDANPAKVFLGNSVVDINAGAFALDDVSYQNTAYVRFLGGSGGNTFTIHDADPLVSTFVLTGTGVNQVEAQLTGGPLIIHDNGSGNDTVDVGWHGTVQYIHGYVSISNTNSLSFVTVNVDDVADFGIRNVDVSASSIVGLAPASINFDPTSLLALNIYGGDGADTYTIHNTPGPFLGTMPFCFNDPIVQQLLSAVSSETGISISQLISNPIVGNILDGASDVVITEGIDTLRGPTIQQISAGISDIVSHIIGSNIVHFLQPDVTTTLVTGLANDTVNVLGTSGSLVLENFGGFDTVTVGAKGNRNCEPVGAQGILGDVFVKLPSFTIYPILVDGGDVTGGGGPIVGGGDVTGVGGTISGGGVSLGGLTYLIVDDSADQKARQATISDQAITGLAPAVIHYDPLALASLTVRGGSGGNTFTVSNTPDNPAVHFQQFRLLTSLYSGTGADSVSVRATTGDLYIDGQTGNDQVVVSTTAPTPAGTLAGIQGILSVDSTQGIFNLVLDDSGDSTAQQATLDDTNLVGLSPGRIFWNPASLYELEIDGGSGGNTFTVEGTPHSQFLTRLNTGTGADTVYVHATDGTLSIDGQAGQDKVFFGSTAPAPGGITTLIFGHVFVFNDQGQTALNVDDSGDHSTHTVLLDNDKSNKVGTLHGLSPADIGWNTQQVSALALLGPQGGTTYELQGPDFTFPISIQGGSGTDTLEGSGHNTTWQITSTDTGTLDNTLSFTGIENLVGSTGDDTFVLQSGGGLLGFVDGGAGNNTLDESGFGSPAQVTLTKHSPMGVQGGTSGIIGGFKNITSLVGNGPGSNLNGFGFLGNFDTSFQVAGFETVNLEVPGDFSGSFLAPTEGTPQAPVGVMIVSGSMTTGARIKVDFLQTFAVNGNMDGTLSGYGLVNGQVDTSDDTIQNIVISGTFGSHGQILAPLLSQVFVNQYAGHLQETEPNKDIQLLEITGSMLPGSTVTASSIGILRVGQDLAGQADVSGPIGMVEVGGNLLGSVSANSIGEMIVGGSLTGQLLVTGTLGSMLVGGTISGQITVGQLSGLSARQQNSFAVTTGTNNSAQQGLAAPQTLAVLVLNQPRLVAGAGQPVETTSFFTTAPSNPESAVPPPAPVSTGQLLQILLGDVPLSNTDSDDGPSDDGRQRDRPRAPETTPPKPPKQDKSDGMPGQLNDQDVPLDLLWRVPCPLEEAVTPEARDLYFATWETERTPGKQQTQPSVPIFGEESPNWFVAALGLALGGIWSKRPARARAGTGLRRSAGPSKKLLLAGERG